MVHWSKGPNADAVRQKMRENAKDPVLVLKRTAGFARLKEQNHGKSLEEIYGVEKATEIRAKLSLSHAGKTPGAETRAKMSATRKKLRPSEETKQKVSVTRKLRIASGEIILSPRAGSGKADLEKILGITSEAHMNISLPRNFKNAPSSMSTNLTFLRHSMEHIALILRLLESIMKSKTVSTHKILYS